MLVNFYQLTHAAVEHLRRRLLARGWSSTEIATLQGRIQSLHFPGLLAVLGSRKKRSGLLGAELLGEAAQDVAFVAPPDENLETGAVRRFLKAVLHENAALADVPVRDSEGEERKREIFEEGITALARRGGMSFTGEQVERVADLLATGEFYGDIASTTAATLATAHELPLAIAEDIRWSPRAISLLLALSRDLHGTPASAWAVFARLRDGKLERPPALLTNTLGILYATASIAAISEMIRTLLAKDNETFRLAIVIYARSAGIPIEEADLDVLRESAFNTDDPDLGPILDRAIVRLEESLGRKFLIGVLERL
jgi:hypothetical protein